MVDTGCEVDFGRLKRVVGREVYCEEENASSVWTVTLFHPFCQHYFALFCSAILRDMRIRAIANWRREEL